MDAKAKTTTLDLGAEFPAMRMVRTGRHVRMMGKLTFWLLLITVIAMIFAPWQQAAPGFGVVLAVDPQDRAQPYLSPTKGIISYVKPDLREGSYVTEGELLMRLKPIAESGVMQIDTQLEAIKQKRENAIASIKVAEQQEELQREGGKNLVQSLDKDFEAANKKWQQAKNEVDALQADLRDKRNKLNIDESIATRGLISRGELVSSREAAEAAWNKVLKAENAVDEAFAALRSKEEEIEAKKRDIDVKNREMNQKVIELNQKLRTIEKEYSEVDVKRDEFTRLEIKAPRTGLIQQWNGVIGSDAIKEGDQLFVIVPETDKLAVEMKVSGNDLPLIHEGDPVQVQFEGWPAVQFVGWPSVAIGSFSGKVNRVFPTDDGKGYFRVLVVPDQEKEAENPWPDDRYLRQGVRANGWVLLREVALGYEIWRQLNGFPPVIADDETDMKKEKGPKVKLPKA